MPPQVHAQHLLRRGYAIETFDEYDLGVITARTAVMGWSGAGVVSGGTIVSRSWLNGNTTAMPCS